MDRGLVGALVGVAGALVGAAAMLPDRSHLAIATAGLWLIIPVAVGAALGGLAGGIASVTASFLVYDLEFVPPYGTLTIGSLQKWTPLVVYFAVMVIVSLFVERLHSAEAAAQSRSETARHLLDLSNLLLSASSGIDEAIVRAVKDAFQIEGVALLQPVEGHLEVVASAGVPIPPDELSRLRPEAHLPVPLSTGASGQIVQTLALSSSGRPVGLLALRNIPTTKAVREALPMLANQLAFTLERGELRERVHHAELLEEIDRLRQALVGAVSHDLRTPLATIKVASSTLVDRTHPLSSDDVHELHTLIDLQADRLNRLVNNLLDMTRIQTGALEVRHERLPISKLVEGAITDLGSALEGRTVTVASPDKSPDVEADPLLIGQVFVNLLDNANRHAPSGTPIIVEINPISEGVVEVAVSDSGPGVPVEEREAIFETFVRFDTGGRSGLGLAIAKAFVEAHGNRIWVESAPQGGARFVFTLPLAKARKGSGL